MCFTQKSNVCKSLIVLVTFEKPLLFRASISQIDFQNEVLEAVSLTWFQRWHEVKDTQIVVLEAVSWHGSKSDYVLF